MAQIRGLFAVALLVFGCNAVLDNKVRHLAGASGGIDSGVNAAGGALGAGAASGDAGPDLCVGVTCDTPPAGSSNPTTPSAAAPGASVATPRT
jgi:hypothetical protein